MVIQVKLLICLLTMLMGALCYLRFGPYSPVPVPPVANTIGPSSQKDLNTSRQAMTNWGKTFRGHK